MEVQKERLVKLREVLVNLLPVLPAEKALQLKIFLEPDVPPFPYPHSPIVLIVLQIESSFFRRIRGSMCILHQCHHPQASAGHLSLAYFYLCALFSLRAKLIPRLGGGGARSLEAF